MIKANCYKCNIEFTYKPWESGRYCSQECRKVKIQKTTCGTCNKEFEYKPRTDLPVRKYCSNSCAVSYSHLNDQEQQNILNKHFYQNIEKKENGCVFWTGALYPNGYGRLNFKNKSILAHRYAYFIYHGLPLKPSEIIMHSCDQKQCVAKEHLSLGTHKTNSDDCHAKNRHMHGDNHVHAVVTEDQVREIKQKLKNGISRRLISQEYNIKTGTITAIALGKTWKHVTLED